MNNSLISCIFQSLPTSALTLCTSFLIAGTSFAAQPKDSISIAEFGAEAKQGLDNREAIQKAIEDATKKGQAVYIPIGVFEVEGDLWLPSKAHLVGEGKDSTLSFSTGQLRSEKYGRRDFSYTFNYMNQEVYEEYTSPLEDAVEAGTTEIETATPLKIEEGEIVTIFNNVRDTWDVLENKEREADWNGASKALMASGEIAEVAKVNGRKLTLKAPLGSPYPKGSLVGTHGGAKDIVVERLKLTKSNVANEKPGYVIHFEQPYRPRLSELTIEGAPVGYGGGIALSHWVYQAEVERCNITTTTWRGITIENFGTGNRLHHNTFNYTKGGDAAVIILFDIRDSEFYNNTVFGKGKESTNEGGIYAHALTKGNKIYGNEAVGVSEAYGTFYGANNNQIYDNKAKDVRGGLVSWYSRGNEFINNRLEIKSDRPGRKAGIYVAQSEDMTFKKNKFTGHPDIIFWEDLANQRITFDGQR